MAKDFKLIVGVGILLVVIIGGAYWYSKYKLTHNSLPYFRVEVGSEDFLSQSTPPEKKVGDFRFINQHGEVVTQNTFDGIYVADYIFTTCPGICKIMTKEMRRVYEKFKEEPRFKILSHTSKPEEDSIPLLKAYAVAQGVNDSKCWHFVTGDKMQLQRMAYKEYGIINPEDIQEEGSFVHTEMIVLVDKNKYIRGYYDGTDSNEMNLLIQDIQSLLNE